MKWERRYKGSIYAKPGEKLILNNKEISFYRKQPKLKIRFLEETESVVIIFKAKDAYPYKEKLKSFGWKFDGRDKTWNFKRIWDSFKDKKNIYKNSINFEIFRLACNVFWENSWRICKNSIRSRMKFI